jgi:hypothetical protein
MNRVLGFWMGMALCVLCGASAWSGEALRWSTYVTAGTVRALASDTTERVTALESLREMRVERVILEVYRGGTELEADELILLRDFLEGQGFEVIGGIATVPGPNFGVEADVGLHWLNFQAEKTQRDLTRVVRRAAAIFDTFIVDDFLCSGDTSAESAAVKGERAWGDYRMDLMTATSRRVFLEPAREVNPTIHMIVKFPQWYDRFHLFGYDVERLPQLYDQVWVGTETRGSRTQRYGFVQPYEGFVNYRWLRALSGAKIGGAWFDYGDCGEHEFEEQAWQSVLAGAPEIVMFSFAGLRKGHPDHARIVANGARLEQLAAAVAETPVTGIPTYKPPHSDAGGDLYAMDFIGMLGVPIVPTPTFPENSERVFLLTQSARDKAIVEKLDGAENLRTVVMTTGFLAQAADQENLLARAGVAAPRLGEKLRAKAILIDGTPQAITPELRMATRLETTGAKVLLEARADGATIPYLTQHDFNGVRYIVLNSHTFSDADFKAVGEVLLAPRALGMLETPQAWTNTLRTALSGARNDRFPDGALLDAPARVTFQPVGDGWFLQNYHNEAVDITLKLSKSQALHDGFSGKTLGAPAPIFQATIAPRSRLWLMP